MAEVATNEDLIKEIEGKLSDTIKSINSENNVKWEEYQKTQKTFQEFLTRQEKDEKEGRSVAVSKEVLEKINDQLDAQEKVLEQLKVANENITAKNKQIDVNKEFQEKFERGVEGETALEKDKEYLKEHQEVYKSHFKNIIEKQDKTDPLYEMYKDTNIEKMTNKFYSTGVPESAGFLVAPDWEAMIYKIIRETSPVEMYATVRPTASNQVIRQTEDEKDTEAGWVGEQKRNRGETQGFEVEQVKIDIHRLYAQPVISDEMREDSSVNISREVLSRVGDKFMRECNESYVNGEGVFRPRGLLTYPNATSEHDTKGIERLEAETANRIGYDDLVNLQELLFDKYDSMAAWFMTRQVKREIRKIKDNDGRPLLEHDKALDRRLNSLFGKPIHIFQDMPRTLDSGNLAIIYGNLKGYHIYKRMGITMVVDNVTDKGFTKYYVTKRLGAGLINGQGIKFLQTK